MSVESEVPQTEEVVSQPEVVETQAADVINTSIVEHEEAAKKMAEDMKKKEEEMQKMKAALDNLKSELEAANESLAGYKSKELEMMKKEKKAKRMASLLDSGIDSETAEATVEKFDALDDETFATITSLVAAKKMAKKEEEMVEEKKKASIEADASVLETAEVEESVNLSVASDEETEIHNTRAALVDFVCIRLGKKLNKGE